MWGMRGRVGKGDDMASKTHGELSCGAMQKAEDMLNKHGVSKDGLIFFWLGVALVRALLDISGEIHDR